MTLNITDWSKFKLNKAIAELLNPKGKVQPSRGLGESNVFIQNPSTATGYKWVQDVNYLNNYNDLIPMMIKHDVLYQLSKLANQREMAECLYMVLLAKSKEQDNG